MIRSSETDNQLVIATVNMAGPLGRWSNLIDHLPRHRPDVIAFQEVRIDLDKPADFYPGLVAESLGPNYKVHSFNGMYPSEPDLGSAMVTNLEVIGEHQSKDAPGYAQYHILDLILPDSSTLTVGNVHLPSSVLKGKEKINKIKAIIDDMENLFGDSAHAITGDFNCLSNHRVISLLRSLGFYSATDQVSPRSRYGTYPSRLGWEHINSGGEGKITQKLLRALGFIPLRADRAVPNGLTIDRIMYRGPMHTLETKVIGTGAKHGDPAFSDHCGLIAKLGIQTIQTISRHHLHSI